MSVTIHAGGDEEVQVTNTDFFNLWEALGIGTNDEYFDFVGEIEKEVLREQLAAFDRQLAVRKGGRFGHYDWGGMTNAQAANYSKALKDIIIDADVHNVSVVYWA